MKQVKTLSTNPFDRKKYYLQYIYSNAIYNINETPMAEKTTQHTVLQKNLTVKMYKISIIPDNSPASTL